MKELFSQIKELEFETLPTLTEFALKVNITNGHLMNTPEQKLYTIMGYVYFIKQSLTKGMFIACNEDGRLLGIESGDVLIDQGVNGNHATTIRHQQAQERVLFFGYDTTYEDGEYYFGETGSINTVGWIDKDGEVWFNTNDYYGKAQYGTIEAAINDGIKLKLK